MKCPYCDSQRIGLWGFTYSSGLRANGGKRPKTPLKKRRHICKRCGGTFVKLYKPYE